MGSFHDSSRHKKHTATLLKTDEGAIRAEYSFKLHTHEIRGQFNVLNNYVIFFKLMIIIPQVKTTKVITTKLSIQELGP